MSRRRFFDFLTPLDSITISWVKGMNNAVPFEVKKIFDTYFVKSVTSGIKVKDIIIKSNGIYLPFVNNTNDSWRNIAQNNYHGTIEGVGLQFDSYHGWHNPIGTGWVDLHFNPNIQGGLKFQKDNCGIVLGLFNAQPTLTDTVILNVDATLRIGRYSTGFRARLNNIATSNFDFIGLPFLNGNFSFNRTASNAMNAKNQNTTNTTSAILSSSVPSESMRLFSDGITPYLGGINFVYNGPSLTDAEYTALNNAVNETLIQLLFYKFGNDNWGVKMAKSYFYDLHGFEKYEAWEVYEFIKRMQPDYVDGSTTGYYYNTFGPSGQNKTICDFIMLFKAGGNLIANAWTKTGATLRWNQDGTITSSNTMPAYTRGTNLGIVTVSSTDGWNGVTSMLINQTATSVNSFYGNLPKLSKLFTSATLNVLYGFYNRIKQNWIGDNMSIYKSIHQAAISYPGAIKLNISSIVGGSYVSYFRISGFEYNSNSLINGSVSILTNEFTDVDQVIEITYDYNITGSIGNISSIKAITVSFQNTSINSGLNVWNKNIATFNISNCLLPTSAVDSQYSVIDNYYVGAVVPIKSTTVNMSGTGMGVPTGGNNNTNRLSILAKYVAAGWVATLTNNT